MRDPTHSDRIEAAEKHGASAYFVACLATEVEGRHIAREVASRAARRDVRPLMGDFTEALWNGDLERAWAHADHQSRRLMEAAEVAP